MAVLFWALFSLFLHPIQAIHINQCQVLLWLSYHTWTLTWGCLAFTTVYREPLHPLPINEPVTLHLTDLIFNSTSAWPMALFKQVVVKDDDANPLTFISVFHPCCPLACWPFEMLTEWMTSGCPASGYVHINVDDFITFQIQLFFFFFYRYKAH